MRNTATVNGHRPEIKKCNVFTLVEMAVVMIIIGLLVAAGASAYTMYLKDKAVQDTNLDINTVVSAIGDFRASYGRYPCPASLAVDRTDPDYGHEDCSDMSGIAPGSCTAGNGICIESSPRVVEFKSGGTTLPPENPRVRAGFVPFRTLNLLEEQAYDGYYGRYKYVATERLTQAHTFMVNGGGIEILNDQNDSIMTSSSSAHFLVLSAGESKLGAHTSYGVQVPCAATGLDKDNCELKTDAIYRLAETNTSGGNGQFDDIVKYFTLNEIPLWQRSAVPGRENDIHQKPSGYITRVNNPPVTALTESWIEGTVRAVTIQTQQLCMSDESDCFVSSVIGGDTAEGEGMECTNPGEVAYKIEFGDVVCAPAEKRCPPDEFLTGVNPDGTIICDGFVPPPVQCPQQDMGICSFTETLPLSDHGTRITITGGANAYKEFRCDDGTWELRRQGGSCTCTPGSESRTEDCPDGFSGSILEERFFTCPDGKWSNWTETDNTCVCTGLPDDTRNSRCPDGLVGNIVQQRSFSCPAGTWSSWTEIENTCTCVPASETRNQKCKKGFTGNIVEERSNSCPSGDWGSWTVISDTCTCKPDTDTRDKNCPDGLTGEIEEQRDFECPAGDWTSWYEISNTCTCVPVTDSRTINCPPGESGEITEERTLACPDATWTNWTEIENTCAPPPPRTCYWTTTGTAQYQQSSPLGKPVGQQCNCGDFGGCHVAAGSNLYNNWTSCNCED